jgi:hypothetical protein
MLLGCKKEWHTDTYYNIVEVGEQAKLKKPATKDGILREMSREGKSLETEGRLVVT